MPAERRKALLNFLSFEAFREVLALDAGNREARAALEELEPKRKQLIKEFLERADQHFARQELERAAPFYQQVLRLDPGNQRAREGLEMHRRMEELKRQNPPQKK